jgi:hypothetical protein
MRPMRHFIAYCNRLVRQCRTAARPAGEPPAWVGLVGGSLPELVLFARVFAYNWRFCAHLHFRVGALQGTANMLLALTCLVLGRGQSIT